MKEKILSGIVLKLTKQSPQTLGYRIFVKNGIKNWINLHIYFVRITEVIFHTSI